LFPEILSYAKPSGPLRKQGIVFNYQVVGLINLWLAHPLLCQAYQVALAHCDSVDAIGALPVLHRPCGGWSAAAIAADEQGDLGDDDATADLASSLASQTLNQTPASSRAEMLEAERIDAMLLPSFLDHEEVLQVIGAAESMADEEFYSVDTDISVFGHDVCFSADHVALNLHRDGHLARAFPTLATKIIAGMRTQPGHWCDPALELNVRCVEFHTYHVGGGLMTEGHKDHGSMLSMSILLSDAEAVEGGRLMTWHCGVAHRHVMQRGDALLFPSLKTHNVSPITRGVRLALVIELWRGETNTTNRYH
jgi:hypothetical protein